MPPKAKKGGKGKNDDWDDDAAEKKLEKLTLADKKAEEVFSESEDEAPAKPAAKSKMAAFAMLGDSDDDSDTKHSDPEAEVQKEESPINEQKEDKKTDKKKKQKGGKKGKEKADDDELDALLENLDKPIEKEEKGKKAKKKEKAAAAVAAAEAGEEGLTQPEVPEGDAPAEAATAEDDGKKKKKKKKGGKEKEETPDGEEVSEKVDEEMDGEEKKEGEDEGEEGEEEGKDRKKRKKDKKKKEKDEAGKKDGKKKKHVDMIKELLRAKQEAEEAEARRIKEEEERLEAIAIQKEEEERLAREKKEREKQKKKEKEEELKRQGKFLTAKQKEQLRLNQAKLAAANIQLPVKDSAEEGVPKKKIVYETKKQKELRLQQQRLAAAAEQSKPETPSPAAEPGAAEPAKTPSAAPEEKTPSPVEEKLVEEKVEEEPLDDWEMAEEVEAEKSPSPATAALSQQPVSEKAAKKEVAAATSKKSSEEEGEEEESSEEDESESEESDESESEEEESESDSEEETAKGKETKEQIAERVRMRLKKRRELAESRRSTDNLRAPVICVLGHVDTGKTKMLDTIRRTNVQDGEAGGITQQIGATEVPAEAIKERCKHVRDFDPDSMKVPGFLIIDTPGHESFSNLRSRGSSLCDFAILVVDIMHGLEPQTIESLKLLLKRGTPFVIALNKIDRLYGYESNPRKDVYAHLKSQPNNAQLEFKDRYNKIVAEFAEQGVNVCLSNQLKDRDDYVAMVPTSAFMGDGIGNIMSFICMITQTRHAQKLAYSEELDATVMEVKAMAGMGTTMDVIIVNGELKVDDVIIVTGIDGAIMAQIRGLCLPHPLRELRVKNEYLQPKSVKGAQGVKVMAKGLEKALAGLPIFVPKAPDEVEVLKKEAEAQLSKALMAIKKKTEGVYVQASTLGSLEALLEFLKSQKIPYSNVNIGPVHKKDVQKASAMLEHNPEYACILAFDVRVEREAQQFADKEGVRVFQADIIYHLEDEFLKYRAELRMKARKDNEHLAVFPCKLRILPQHIFNARNPIVVGVNIEAGQLKKGTPICVPSKDSIFLGNVASIERNHEQVDLAKQGEEVCIKIENTTGEAPKLYGRHFTHEDALVSRISRESIDVCKTYFRDDLTKLDWQLVIQLKRLLDIM